eukprot:g34037.t1
MGYFLRDTKRGGTRSRVSQSGAGPVFLVSLCGADRNLNAELGGIWSFVSRDVLAVGGRSACAGFANMEDSGSSRPMANLDHPPNSRLFLVISKSTSEEVIRENFSFFGDIQDIWVVRDKQNKDHKGIAYVKFAKSSQACRAMEEMHGKALTEDTKPIK